MFSPRTIAVTTATAPKAAAAVCAGVVIATIGGTSKTGPGIEVSV